MKIEVVVMAIATMGSVNAMTKRGLRLVEQGIHENSWAVERKRSLSIADSTSAAAKQAKQVADAAAAASTTSTTSGTASKTGTTSSSSTTAGSGSTGGAATTTSSAGTTSGGTAGGSGTAAKAASSTTNTSTTSSSTSGGSTTPKPATKTTVAASPKNATTTVATNTTAVKKPAPVSSKNTTDTSTNSTGIKPADSSSSSGIPAEIASTYDDVGDDDAYNASYPLFHYEDIQKETNSSRNWNHSALHDDLESFMPEAVQKNLSTTKTPFLPSEQKQPKNWPKMVGGLFLVVALVLIAITIVRNIRKNMKRRNYEEVQNLVV